jgi:hypothetical protein
MRFRAGLRARTDFSVITHIGQKSRKCRAVELSPSGLLLEAEGDQLPSGLPLLMRLELRLPERLRPLVTWARPIWSRGKQQAVKFVGASDVDRLSLAEHLDLQRLRGRTFK